MNNEIILFITPIVTTLTAIVSFAFEIPKRLVPLAALFVGIVMAGLLQDINVSIWIAIQSILVNGIISGLSAIGLYSGGKSLIQQK